jgi:phage recombination protein Bet
MRNLQKSKADYDKKAKTLSDAVDESLKQIDPLYPRLATNIEWRRCPYCLSQYTQSEIHICRKKSNAKKGLVDKFINLLGTEEWQMSNLPAEIGSFNREQMAEIMLPAEASKINLDLHYLMALKAKHPNVTTPDFVNFVHKAQKFGADPIKNQVYLVAYARRKKVHGRWETVGYDANAIFSYQFFISRAEQSGVFDGWDEPETKMEEYFNPETGKAAPTLRCKVKIFRTDRSRPTVYTAWYPEFVKMRFDKDKKMWVPTEAWTKPMIMLEKCALCNGLRQSFPEQLGGMRSEYEKVEKKEVDLSDESDAITVETTAQETAEPSEEPEPIEVEQQTSEPDPEPEKKVDPPAPGPEPETQKETVEEPVNERDDPGEYVPKVSKFKDAPLNTRSVTELASYLVYMKGSDVQGPLKEVLEKIRDYCFQMGLDV